MNYQDSVRATLGAIDAAWSPTGITILYHNTSKQPPTASKRQSVTLQQVSSTSTRRSKPDNGHDG